MRLDLSRLGIRHQLLGLFGLFLLTGALVVAVDEIGQHYAQRSMEAMKDDVLVGMRRIRRLSDAYGMDVVDTTFRTRNYLIGWEEAGRRIERAQATMAEEWKALQAMPLDEESRALLAQALRARPRADEAAADLRRILARRDILALGRFADRELYTAVDPLVQRLERIALRGQERADALAREALEHGIWISRVRIGLSLACVLLALLFGRRILRDGYRGVESLTGLARRMTQNDYSAQPQYLPRGELGEVMDSFLRMRDHVRRMEGQLTEQLTRTDRVRVALERREQFQRLLLEAAQTAIIAVDEDGVFSQVNPFAEKLLGWPAGALLGREKLDVVLDPEALGALARSLSEAYGRTVSPDWTALRELARHREPPREFALRHQRGRTLPVLLALSAMRDDTGAMVGLLAVATDLTMQKRLERALRDSEARAREASHAKSAFLAAMSHEIRTPMIGVTGMIEILGHTDLDPEQRRALGDHPGLGGNPAADHRRHPRFLEDRGRQDGDRAGADFAAGTGAQRGRQLLGIGIEQGPGAGQRSRSAGRAGAPRRPGAAAPGDRQLPVERDQVHRPRQGHRRGEAAAAHAGRRRAGQRPAGTERGRHRHRHQRAGAGAAVQAVLAGGSRHHPPVRRHRPRAWRSAAASPS